MMRAHPNAMVALVLLVFAMGCDPRPRTQIILVVTADQEVRNELASLRIRILGNRPSEAPTVSYDETESASGLQWPVELGIVPRDGDLERTFLVEVSSVTAAGAPSVIARVSTSFVAGQTRVLAIHLAAGCIGVICLEGSTCRGSTCGPVPIIDPSTLPEHDGGSAQQDGGSDGCVMQTFYADEDGDGFGNAAMPMQACMRPPGAAVNDTDCNDACFVCNPGASEQCGDNRDENCDDVVDEGCSCTNGQTQACGTDEGECVAGTQMCVNQVFGTCEGDVEATAEICNGLDDDCDGTPDGAAVDAACASGPNVESGSCGGASGCQRTCVLPFTSCSSGCVDTLTDASNCGSCANACAGVEMCIGGSCQVPPPHIDGTVGYTCGVRNGQVFCWGVNDSGQLGNGTMTNSSTPVMVNGISDAVEVAVGALDGDPGRGHTCVRHATGTVSCWGFGSDGRLGDGLSTTRFEPGAPVSNLSNVAQIDSGGSHTCARLNDGTVRCWGSNADGQLGNGDVMRRDQLIPVPVMDLNSVVHIALGKGHSCAVRNDGTVWCWGANYNGEVTGAAADGNQIIAPRQKQNITIGAIVEVTGGLRHTCARNASGTTACWGYNFYSQFIPTTVSDAIQLSAGGIHTCWRRTGMGAVYCAGDNSQSQLGGANPALVSSAFIAAGHFHTCALTESGQAYCWGDNQYGQLGTGNTMDAPVPVLIAGF